MKQNYIKIFTLCFITSSALSLFAQELDQDVFSSQKITQNKSPITKSSPNRNSITQKNIENPTSRFALPEKNASQNTNHQIFFSVGGTPKQTKAQQPYSWATTQPIMHENLSAEVNMGTSKVKANSKGVYDDKGYAYSQQPNLIPPTATAQITLSPEEKVRPYVGLGFNYTEIYDETGLLPKNMTNRTPYQQGVLGSAIQLGADFDITDSIYLNLDAKKLNMRSATTTPNGTEQDIDQWIYGLGLGVRF